MNQLRPLTLGEILDRTAELYRRRFLLFAGIAAVFSGLMLLVQLAGLGVNRLAGYPHAAPHLAWVVAVTAVIQALAILLIAGLSIAANNRAVAWLYLDHPATVSAAIGSVKPRLGRYIWLMTISCFKAWGPLAVFYAAMFGIFIAKMPHAFTRAQIETAPPPDPTAVATIGLIVLALVPFILAAAVYGTWMSLRLSLGMPACVVEEMPARKALKRSVELSEGTKGRIFVLGLLVVAIRLVLGGLLSLPFFFFMFTHIGKPIPLPLLALQQFVGFLTNTFIGPIYATGLTLFYYDQRIRKEGFDIEWMMQAAGLAQPADPVLDAGSPALGEP